MRTKPSRRELRAQFQAAQTKVSGQGQILGAFMGSKGRSAMARSRSFAKRDLATKQQDTLLPYARVKAAIDGVIAQLDAAKADIVVTKSAARTKEPKADDVAGQVARLAELRDQGVLSDEELEAAKRKAIGASGDRSFGNAARGAQTTDAPSPA